MSLNSTRTRPLAADAAAALAHENPMGGTSYAVTNPLSRLQMAAASCFFGEPQYYAEPSAVAKLKRNVHDSDEVPGYYVSQLTGMLGNALLKSSFIFKNYGLDCFADDTGLEVEALEGHRACIPHVMPTDKDMTLKPT
jgi:hypothetical protein